jgi:predicted permease
MVAEIRYGVRQLKSKKVISSVIIVLVGLSIGVNTIIFAVVNSLLLETLPVKDPNGLFIFEKIRGTQTKSDHLFNYVEFEQASQRKDLFSSAVAEQAASEANLVPLGNETGHNRSVSTQIVSPDYFGVLGVQSEIGRVLTKSDPFLSDIPVILSNRFWKSEFGGDHAILGRTVLLKNRPFVVVGVLQREFHGVDVDHDPDVRLPISAAPFLMGYAVSDSALSGPAHFEILARLAPNVSPIQAASAVFPQLTKATEEAWYEWNSKQKSPMPQRDLRTAISSMINYRVTLTPVSKGLSQLRTELAQPLEMLMATAVLLFIVVCANISALLSGALQERRSEMAIRFALGAPRKAIVQQGIIESLVLIVPGFALGIAIALGVAPLVIRLISGLGDAGLEVMPRLLVLKPDLRVVIFVIGTFVFSILAFAMASVTLDGRITLSSELKGNFSTPKQRTLRPLLVALQIACTVIFLNAGALMIRSFMLLQRVDIGFDPTNVIEFVIDPSKSGYSDVQISVFARSLLDNIGRLSTVSSSSFVAAGLMQGVGLKATVTPLGTTNPPDTIANTSVNFVTPNYFKTMSIPFQIGREFSDRAADTTPVQIVINRAFADLFFPKENPIGKFLVFGADGKRPPNAVIVGVVGTSKYRSLREDDPATYYAPWNYNEIQAPLLLYVRGVGRQDSIINSIRQSVSQLDRSVPIMRIIGLTQQIQASLWRERLMAQLSVVLGVTALTVASVGIYGALAHSIRRQSRELALRMVLGASLRQVAGALCGTLTLHVAFGLIVGCILASSVVRVARHFVFGIGVFDLTALLVSVFAVTSSTGIVASVAAWKAWNRDPAAILRE